MTKQRRYPLLLDERYPPERELLQILLTLPKGERRPFLRTLIMAGHQEIAAERKRNASIPQAHGDGESNA